MSQSTDASQPSLDALPTDPEVAAEKAKACRSRGIRPGITKADLTMYSAITGRAPSREERERALTWREADAANTVVASAVLPAHALKPWHPAAVSMRIRDIWMNGISIRVNRPQISHWVRRVSIAIQQGRERVKQVR